MDLQVCRTILRGYRGPCAQSLDRCQLTNYHFQWLLHFKAFGPSEDDLADEPLWSVFRTEEKFVTTSSDEHLEIQRREMNARFPASSFRRKQESKILDAERYYGCLVHQTASLLSTETTGSNIIRAVCTEAGSYCTPAMLLTIPSTALLPMRSALNCSGFLRGAKADGLAKI